MSTGRKKVRGAAGYRIQRRPNAISWEVIVSPEAQPVLRELFGRELEAVELAGLGLATPGSRIEVDVDEDNDPVIRTIAPDLEAANSLQMSPGGLELVIGFVTLPEHLRKRGLGTSLLYAAIQTATRLRLRRIVAFATRGRDVNGYYTFPRLGFDGIIPSHLRKEFPDALRNIESVLQLMNTEDGPETWLRYGASISVFFDLSHGSRSQKALEAYMANRRRS